MHCWLKDQASDKRVKVLGKSNGPPNSEVTVSWLRVRKIGRQSICCRQSRGTICWMEISSPHSKSKTSTIKTNKEWMMTVSRKERISFYKSPSETIKLSLNKKWFLLMLVTKISHQPPTMSTSTRLRQRILKVLRRSVRREAPTIRVASQIICPGIPQ